MIAQWLRAARQNPGRRRTAFTYAGFIAVAQLGWVGLAIAHTTLVVTIALATLLYLIELAGPWIAERRAREGGTPWHAHHIAERLGLLTIIALGEGVFGTITAVSAVIDDADWSFDAAVLVVAGVGLTFGLWWTYFLLPAGMMLRRYRNKAFVWGYGHLVVFAAITATGAGLHVIAYVVEGESELGPVAAVMTVALPVLLLCVTIFALYAYLISAFDSFHVLLLAGTVVVLLLAVLTAAWGAPLSVSLMLITLAPFVTVVAYETIGHRHEAAMLARHVP